MSFLFNSVPAQDDAVVALLQPLDDAKHILREGKTNHNVKNVLAAAIRAAEKDATGDIRDKRIIDEAKKVLAQFDTAAQDGAFLKGEKVKFTNGPFAGKTGEYVRELGIGTHIVKVDGVEQRCSIGQFRIASANDSAQDGAAQDYDPNPATRGKDIENYVAQAGREEQFVEGLILKVIESVEELRIRIHGPMKDWEEVIEDCQLSPELPQAKKWNATANARYDYLLKRERAFGAILSELRRNHIR